MRTKIKKNHKTTKMAHEDLMAVFSSIELLKRQHRESSRKETSMKKKETKKINLHSIKQRLVFFLFHKKMMGITTWCKFSRKKEQTQSEGTPVF